MRRFFFAPHRVFEHRHKPGLRNFKGFIMLSQTHRTINANDQHGNSVARQAMDITDEMLNAAVRKAIEAGLLPRNASREDATGSKELMRTIVLAAMAAASQEAFHAARSYGRHSTAPEVKRALPTYAYS